MPIRWQSAAQAQLRLAYTLRTSRLTFGRTCVLKRLVDRQRFPNSTKAAELRHWCLMARFPVRSLAPIAWFALAGLPPLAAASAQDPVAITDSSQATDSIRARATQTFRVPSRWFTIETPVLVTGDSVERWAEGHRSKAQPTAGYLLRSSSSLTGVARRSRIALLAPSFAFVTNSALPYSINDGPLWAGRGANYLVSAGADIRLGRLRLYLLPELATSSNQYWQLRDSTRFPPPGTREERQGGGYVFPWFTGPYSIDLPLRFGDKSLSKVTAGQSAALIDLGKAAVGWSTENEWWGPGVRNSLVLSNNAPGFPHAFLRTTRPLSTPLGMLEARWIAGTLTESKYFDTTSGNDSRSIAAMGVTLNPRRASGLTIGLARAVYSTADNAGAGYARWLDVFRNTGHPNERALGDSSLTPGGSEQIFSLFSRLVLPSSGFEGYVELARTEFPKSLRDLLVTPNHTQGYTLGLQWSRAVRTPGAALRLQGELTTIEQSASFRDRPIGSFYTSRRVIQGYTNEGQALGAAIGPGASGQWLAGDFLMPGWRGGIYLGRVRWHEDVRSVYNWPDYLEYCNHDVSFFVGGRAAAYGRFGSVSADLNLANRINAFFQVQSGCPSGPSQLDIRNRTLSITFAPFSRR